MAVRIERDEHEQAVLLCALISVLDHKIQRKQAIAAISQQLREYAISRGIVIDEKYRNENGIALQISKLEYAFTNGKTGLHVDNGWYFSIVKTYRNDYRKYMKLLGGVVEVPATESEKERIDFVGWIKENNPKEAERIVASLLILSKKRHSNILKKLDIGEIESLIRQISSKKGGRRKKYTTALRAYRDYLNYVQGDTRKKQNQKETYITAKQSGESKTQIYYTVDRGRNEKEYTDSEGLSFGEWLRQVQGMAEGSVRSYDSAINTAEKFAQKHNIGSGTLRGTTDYGTVSETADALFQSEEFIEINQQQHNRFHAAMRKYLQYLRGGNVVTGTHRESSINETFEGVDFTPYKEILAEKFPRGFRIDSRLDMGRLRNFWKEKYGAVLNEEDETVRKRISHITVRCQNFVYLPEMMMSDQTAERIIVYLDECFKSGKAAVYFDALYTEFKSDFVGKRINNPDMLKCYMTFANNNRYYIHKTYLTAEPDADVNPADEIRDYMITIGVPVSVDELVEALSHINADTVYRTVAGSHSAAFVRNQKGEYFHADIIRFTQQEMDTITEMIQHSIDDKGYMGGKELTDAGLSS